jgi:hypothetical protein
VTVDAHVVLGDRERLAGGDAELELDQVEAGDASVTGCSTCRRVLTSRKLMTPSSPTMNSTVPALW